MRQCDLLQNMSMRVSTGRRRSFVFVSTKIEIHTHFQFQMSCAIFATIKRLHMIRSVNDMISIHYLSVKSHNFTVAFVIVVVVVVRSVM